MLRTNLQKGLVGHWTMDGIDNDTVRDSSAYENNGDMENNLEIVEGIIGDHSLEFDGLSTRVDGNNFNLGQNDFSVSAWLYIPEGAPSSENYDEDHRGGVVGQGSSGHTWVGFRGSNGANRYVRSEMYSNDNSYSEGWRFSSSTQLEKEKWHFIVFTAKRKGEVKFFINGDFDTSEDISHASDENIDINTKIGHNSWMASPDEGEHFYGRMDDVRIYNRAISKKEIRILYNMRNRQVRGV